MGTYIDCVALSQQVKDVVKEYFSNIKETYGLLAPTPLLFVVRCGDNPASEAYVRNKKKVCEEVGIVLVDKKVEPTFDAMMNAVASSSLEAYHRGGVIMQLPLPDNFTEEEKETLLQFIDDECDVDGLGDNSSFIPCTPLGCLEVINHLIEIGEFPADLANTNVTIIGRSQLVGSPLRELLLMTNATLTLCHSKTKDINEHIKNADIIISAVGKRDFITKEMLADNTSDKLTLIDVGINRDENGKLCGDFSRDAVEVAKYATPVPKGIGLMTTSKLVENVMRAYKNGVDVHSLDKKKTKAMKLKKDGSENAERIASMIEE